MNTKKYVTIPFKQLRLELDNVSDDNIDLLLDQMRRQVRYLYHNANKCAIVYDEKLVRLMIHRLREKIEQLKNN